MLPENEKLLTIKQAASQFSVHQATIYREIKEGRLHATKVGRQLRIRPSEVQRYLAAGEVSAAPQE